MKTNDTKKKHIDWIAFIFVYIGLMLARFLKLGAIDAGLLCGLFGGLGGVISWCFRNPKKDVISEVKKWWANYLQKTTKDESKIKWYAKPKYWLCILVLYTIILSVKVYYPNDFFEVSSFALIFIAPLVWLILKESLLAMVLLVIFKVFDLFITTNMYLTGNMNGTNFVMFLLWAILWGWLLFASIKIALINRKNKKIVSKDIWISLGLGLFFVVMFCIININKNSQTSFKETIYTTCYNQTQTLIDNESVRTEYCNCFSNKMFESIDWKNNTFVDYPDIDYSNETEKNKVLDIIYEKSAEDCTNKIIKNQ